MHLLAPINKSSLLHGYEGALRAPLHILIDTQSLV